MRKTLVFFIFTLLIMTSQIFAGNVYYVDATNGDDNNSGASPDQAWKTVGKVNDEMRFGVISTGDDVLFKRGETFTDKDLWIGVGGTSSDYMIICDYGSGDLPTFDGISIILTEGYNYIKIRNLRVKNTSGNSAGFALSRPGRSSILSTNIQVLNCETKNTGGAGIIVQGIDTFLIEGCLVDSSGNVGIGIYGSPTVKATNGTISNNVTKNATDINDGISIHKSDDGDDVGSNHIVINNESYGNGGNGIDLTSGDNITVETNNVHGNSQADIVLGHGVSNVILKRNYIHDGNHHAIQITSASSITFENNIVYNPKYCCLDLAATGTLTTVTAYNNTFVSTARAERPMIRIVNNTNGFTVKNNIIILTAANTRKLISFSYTTPNEVGCDFSHNVWWRPDGNPSIPNELLDAYSFVLDPQLLNPKSGDFHLKSNSMCIDTGTDVGLTQDFEGNKVPQGFAPDIGAYEYQGINPLNVNINASPTSGEVPLTVNFTGSATGGVPPYSYSWDFGDDTSSSEQNPSHTYSQASIYTVNLTVTDSESNQDNDSLIINASAATSSPYLFCSLKSLYFGATTSGNETTDQYLRIINAGGGTLTWNIEDDAGWLSCSPSSGTDRGEIIVSVNASGLSLGLYVATITVSSPEAYNSPQYVSVNFRIYEPEQENPPFGSLDTPVNGSTVSGSIPITGWALDDIEVVRLEIKRNSDPLDLPEAIGSDGLVYIGDAVFVEGARPDVEKSYTDYPLNSRAGWGYMLLTNDLPYRGNGSFTIYGFAYDAGGNREEIGRKTILCDNVNRVKPFGTIDTHEQGEIIRESDYINFGWALTPLPKTIPKDGSTIWVWVDGVQVGHPVYDQYREDIATFYPEYNNAQGAVGYYYLDTTQYENGAHTIAWSVMDDDGEADEIGARYFFIDNIETGSAYHGPLGLRSIYREDVEGRLRTGIKEVGKEYRPQVDIDRELNAKSILNIQIEEMEPLRIVLEEGSGGNMEYIGWGENKWKALPIGSTLDREKGIFSWIPTPGFIGRYVFHFAVTDGSYMSKPLRVEVNVIPKSYD